MNLPNQLTLFRIALIPFFMFFLLYERIGGGKQWVMVFRFLALAMFVLALVTDYIDGILARRRGMVTDFGKLFDPLADKLLAMAALVSLVELQVFPAWIVVLILFREFMITGLRTLGVMKGRVIQADRWGKKKTVAQAVTIVVALCYLCIRDTLELAGRWRDSSVFGWSLEWWFEWGLRLLIYLCALLTLVSGMLYFSRNRDLIREM